MQSYYEDGIVLIRKVDVDANICKIVEKLRSRLNRRLQKLARWGDNPVDDRQPAEIRMQLRSNFHTQFKSSFGGLLNLPIPSSQPVPSRLPVSSSTNALTKTQQNPSHTVTAASIALGTALSSSCAGANISSFSTDRTAGLAQNRVANMFNSDGLGVGNPPPACLPQNLFSTAPIALAALQMQSQLPASNLTSTGVGTPGSVGNLNGMLNSVRGATISMGGVKMDLEAIRASQMQSVEELSMALKSEEFVAATALASTSSEPLIATTLAHAGDGLDPAKCDGLAISHSETVDIKLVTPAEVNNQS